MAQFSSALRAQANQSAEEQVSPHLPRMTLKARVPQGNTLQTQSLESLIDGCINTKILQSERHKNSAAAAGPIADNLEKKFGASCEVSKISVSGETLKLELTVATHDVEEAA